MFTWCDETYEEIAHQVDTFTRLGRTQTLQHYLDGMLQVPVRINAGKVFLLRATGQPARMTIADFHLALRDEPALYAEWIQALRQDSNRAGVEEADVLVSKLIAIGEAAIAGVPQHGAGGAPRPPLPSAKEANA